MMIGIASLPRAIQKLADAKGWEEEDLLGLMAAFVAQNSLEDELLEYLQEEGEIRLLRQHGILSMVTWVAGFDDQTDADLFRGLRQLVSYDADQIQALYVTPHRWTPFFRIVKDRPVVQSDPTKWDYKHQVLGMARMTPGRLFLWVKLIEAVAQLRPRALMRWIWHPDPKLRHAIRWCYRMGRRV